MDVEAALIAHLGTTLGVPAAGDVPSPRPAMLVTVERTGGPCDALVDEASLAVQCWGPTRAAAAELAASARRALPSMEEADGVASCECDSMAWFPGEAGEPRYQLAVHVTAYA